MTGKRALTLVEMVVALAIVCLLAVACLQVTVGLARAQRAAEADRNEFTWDSSLEQLLTTDLLQASHVRRTRGGFELRALAQLQGHSMALEHLPVRVGYEVRRAGPTSLLVRTQRRADGRQQSELVCCGAGKVSVTAGSSSGKKLSGAWKTMPEAVTVQVDRTDGRAVKVTVRKR